MHDAALNKFHILKKVWGFEAFRPLQAEIIDHVLNEGTAIALLPTGGGKSLCYQLPAVMLNGITLVVSPLLSLMEDQHKQLNALKIPNAYITAYSSPDEREAIYDALYKGELKVFFCSPERLMNAEFIENTVDVQWSLLVIDEAHCISQWGHDFRPAYLKIVQYLDHVKIPKKLLLTASATTKVVEDMKAQMQLESARVFKQSIVRPNLSFQIIESSQKASSLQPYLNRWQTSNIIYCNTRNKTEEMAAWLKGMHIDSVYYHAGMSNEERMFVQKKWFEAQDITICATNAFGMGINKPNVRLVVHTNPPSSIENFYQEAGRAGRDGAEATCVLVWNQHDIKRLQALPQSEYPEPAFILKTYNAVCNFLQVGLHTAKDQLFFLDPVQCSRNFKLPLIPFLNAIEIISREGYWIWNKSDTERPSFKFICDRNDVDRLAQIDKDAYQIAIRIIRQFHGVFTHYVYFNMATEAKGMKLDYETLLFYFNQLHGYGILDFKPARRGSSLYFLEDRQSSANFRLDEQNLKRQAENCEQRVTEMINLLTNAEQCRMQIMAKYFDEGDSAPCGRCDVCMRKRKAFDKNEFQPILLEHLTHQQALNIHSLQHVFPTYNSEDVALLLQELKNEEYITINEQGWVSIK